MSDKSNAVGARVVAGLSRRKFLTGLAMGAGLAPFASRLSLPLGARRLASQVSSMCAPPPGSVLRGSDFTLLGSYAIGTDTGGQASSITGLTHRYINGDLRLMTLYGTWGIQEFSVAGKNFGDVITLQTNKWLITDQVSSTEYFGSLWYDEPSNPNGRVWTSFGTAYPAGWPESSRIQTRTLNADGSTGNFHGSSNFGGYGVSLEGVTSRLIMGGFQKVPAWFQAHYGVPAYVCGWGGYASRVALDCSLGPVLCFIPDVAGYGSTAQVPASAINFAVNTMAGVQSSQDWYDAGVPTTFDTGLRLNNPTNYFADPTPYSSRPTSPPFGNPRAQWLSPAPDGRGRQTWGDTYSNTGCWIDGPNKQGFIMVGQFAAGYAWYQGGDLKRDTTVQELHIWDVNDIGKAALGQIPKWKVYPNSMTDWTSVLNYSGGANYSGKTSGYMNPMGATFDPVTKRLYVIGARGTDDNHPALWVFSVNC